MLQLGVSALAHAGSAGGDACMPLDVVNLLKSDVATEVASRCQDVIDEDGRCTADCAEVARRFQSEHCYPHLTQSQRLQPRHQGHALVSLQGVWFGLYPASGVELVEVTWDAGRGLLLGTKLTGNQFVRAGRVSWESAPPPPPRATARAAATAHARRRPHPPPPLCRAAVSQTACRVVSSVWAGAYTPRWDPCRLRIGDADHVEVVLPLGNGEEEVLAFVRATAPLLLEWEDESSPARGFARVFDACGLPPPAGSSLFAGLADWLHHSQHTVVVDQALILFPALLLGGWQLSESNAALQRLIVAAAGLYCVVACLRLRHLGYIQ